MRQKVYCGTKQALPEGYARFANRYQCLKKGYGACLYAGRRGRGRGVVAPPPPPPPLPQQRLLRRLSVRIGIMMVVFALLVSAAAYYFVNRLRQRD